MLSSSFSQDVRVAFRGLLQAPGLTFVVVLTLAVAIGANTAIFSVVDGVLRSPLPYPDEDRIVKVAATVHATDANSGGDRGNAFSDRGYWHFANNNRSFEKFGGYVPGSIPFPLTGEGPPRQVGVSMMTLGAFEVLGVTPELGRLPTAEEAAPNGPAVALLSHELWASQYASDPSIIGRTVQLNGVSREVIGVMPAGYNFATPGAELWMPWQPIRRARTSAATTSWVSRGFRRASPLKLRSVTRAASSRAMANWGMDPSGSRVHTMAALSFAPFAT
jgi:hypothetical protein